MAINRNSKVAEEIRDVFKLQQNVDGQISNVAGQIIPVVDVNPKHSRVCDVVLHGFSDNATAVTILTTPTDKDFYLVAASIALIKDATSTSVNTDLRMTIEGVERRILSIPSLTLTAQSLSNNINLPFPVKIDRNTQINIVNSTNVANIKSVATIVGYYVTNPKA